MLDKVCNGVYRDIEQEELRDPLATRLLDFIDCPVWRGMGLGYLKNAELYHNCDDHRYLISRIVIRVSQISMHNRKGDYDCYSKVTGDVFRI